MSAPTRYVAFLRAINIGGHVVTMDVLRKEFVAVGLKDAETFIASGNVVFSSGSNDVPAIQRKIETRLKKSLGYEVKTFLRSAAEVAAIAAHTPFPAPAMKNAGAFVVGFFEDELNAAATKTILGYRTDIDDFHVKGREMYWLCQKRQSESTFFRVRIDKVLNTPTTFRGLNTVTRLVAKYGFK